MTPAGDTLTRLRSATRAQHGRLAALFPRGLACDRDYRHYLPGMRAIVAAVVRADASLHRAYAESLQRLDDDLAALGCPAQPPACSAIDASLHRLGYRYVIDGSSMGARVLVRDAMALGWTPSRGASFLAYHVRRGHAAWPRLKRTLAATDSTDAGALVTGAVAAFAFVADAFIHAATPHPQDTQ